MEEKKRTKRATVIDVAKRAGVSPGTVSNALSGKRSVDPTTFARIQRAIIDLDYVPNVAARGVRTGKPNTIALFSSIPFSAADEAVKLGLMPEIALSATMKALEHNVALLLVPPRPDSDKALMNIAFGGALVIEPSIDDAFFSLLEKRDVPTVVIGYSPVLDIPHFALHDEVCAKLLLKHLIDCGARHFALVIGQSIREVNDVFELTYRKVARELTMPAQIYRVDEKNAVNGAAAAVMTAIRDNPQLDGVLTPIDILAAGVMCGLKKAGVAVPAQVRVATRYNSPLAQLQNPPLTALDLHLDAIAKQATELLLQLIVGKVPAQPDCATPLPDLLVHGSTRA